MPCLMGKCLTTSSTRRSTSGSVSGICRCLLPAGDDTRQARRARLSMRLGMAPARGVHGDADTDHLRRQPARGLVRVGAGDGHEVWLIVDALLHRKRTARMEGAAGRDANEARW